MLKKLVDLAITGDQEEPNAMRQALGIAAVAVVCSLVRAAEAELPANRWVKATLLTGQRRGEVTRLRELLTLLNATGAPGRRGVGKAALDNQAQQIITYQTTNARTGASAFFVRPIGGRTWRELETTGGRMPSWLRWSTMCWDPVDKEVLIVGGNCITAGGTPGTWTFDPSTARLTRLSFKDHPLYAAHVEAEALREEAHLLAGMVRSRWHVAETDEEAKADLGKRANELAGRVRALLVRVGRSPVAGEYSEALRRADAELRAATVLLQDVAGPLGASATPKEIAAVSRAAEHLRRARDYLAVEPPPRINSAMTFNARNKVVVLYGGDHLDYLVADTWIYDCKSRRWRQVFPEVSPSPRAGHDLVYLPRSGRIAMFGGYDYPRGPGVYTKRDLELWTYETAANRWSLLGRWLLKGRHPRLTIVGGPTCRAPHQRYEDRHAPYLLGLATTDDVIVTPEWVIRVDPAGVDPAGTVKYGVSPAPSSDAADGWTPPGGTRCHHRTPPPTSGSSIISRLTPG